MIIRTEIDISKRDVLEYYPLNKCRIEKLKMEDWLKKEGYNIKGYYSFEDLVKLCTVVGIVSEL